MVSTWGGEMICPPANGSSTAADLGLSMDRAQTDRIISKCPPGQGHKKVLR